MKSKHTLKNGDKFIYKAEGNTYVVKFSPKGQLHMVHVGDEFDETYNYHTIYKLINDDNWTYVPVDQLPEELFKI